MRNAYVDSTAASTTQVIYELFCMMGVTIDKQIANCLYTRSVWHGCSDAFQSLSTSARQITLRICSKFNGCRADVAEINRYYV